MSQKEEGHVQGLTPGSGRYAGEEIVDYPFQYSWASLVTQLVKNPPAMQETWVQSLVWEDPLEKGKATHSSILASRIPWTIESMGSQRVGHDWVTFIYIYIYIYIYVYIPKVIQDTGARGKQLTRTQDTHSSPLSTALSLFIATLPLRPFMVSRCSVLILSMNREVQETFGAERQIQPSGREWAWGSDPGEGPGWSWWAKGLWMYQDLPAHAKMMMLGACAERF